MSPRNRKPTAAAGLERLRQQELAARIARREADLDSERRRAHGEALEASIRDAHARGDEDSAEDLEQALGELTATTIPRGERRRDGLSERVRQAELARKQYVAEHADSLLAELRPVGEAARERLDRAADELRAGGQDWTPAREAAKNIILDLDGRIRLEYALPETHGLERAIDEIKRAGPTRAPALPDHECLEPQPQVMDPRKGYRKLSPRAVLPPE